MCCLPCSTQSTGIWGPQSHCGVAPALLPATAHITVYTHTPNTPAPGPSSHGTWPHPCPPALLPLPSLPGITFLGTPVTCDGPRVGCRGGGVSSQHPEASAAIYQSQNQCSSYCLFPSRITDHDIRVPALPLPQALRQLPPKGNLGHGLLNWGPRADLQARLMTPYL